MISGRIGHLGAFSNDPGDLLGQTQLRQVAGDRAEGGHNGLVLLRIIVMLGRTCAGRDLLLAVCGRLEGNPVDNDLVLLG